MHSLKERHRQILSLLLKVEEPLTIQVISQKLSVSPRTIRYDLSNLEYWLKEQGITLMKVPRKGIWIEDLDQASQILKGDMNKLDVMRYRILTPRERHSELLGKLFESNTFLTVDTLSKHTGVSQSTCYKDLSVIEKWLLERDIKLLKIPNKGFKLKSSEGNWRKGLLDYLDMHLGDSELIQLLSLAKKGTPNSSKLEFVNQKHIQSLFPDIEFEQITALIDAFEDKLQMTFVDAAYAGLMIHIAIAIKRLCSGEAIKMPEDQLEVLRESNEFKVIKEIIGASEWPHLIAIPDAEIGYITIHILSAKLREKGGTETFLGDTQKDHLINEALRQFISSVSQQLAFDLSLDETLFNDLLVHIKPMLTRLTFNLSSRNPLLHEVKRRYPMVFNACKKSAGIFKDMFTLDLDDHEIGYLAIHIRSAIEKQSKAIENRALSCLVVCSSGIGTSKMLSSRLLSEFNVIKTIEETSVFNLNSMDLSNYDFLVTTVHLTLEYPIKIFQVSPLLHAGEVAQINAFIHATHPTTLLAEEKSLEDIMTIIKRHCSIENHEALIDDLQNVLGSKKKATQVKQYSLIELIKAGGIHFSKIKMDYESAIKRVASSLVSKGKIASDYVEAILTLCHDFPSHWMIAPQMMMPHANPNGLVYETAMSLLILEHPVVIDKSEIRIILLLAAKDGRKHELAMRQLVELVNIEGITEKLLQSDDTESLLRVIKANII